MTPAAPPPAVPPRGGLVPALRALVRPPALSRSDERTASRLELFFDLAYVLVVAQLAGALAADLTWRGAVELTGLFVVTWWSWVSATLYANRFDTDDVLYRLAKLGTTFAVAVLAASATGAVGEQSHVFALGYLATRLVLLVLYVRAWRHVPAARPTCRAHLLGAGAGSTLWAVSLLVPTPLRYVLWAVGLALEIGVPLVLTRSLDDAPLHVQHLPERFGLFVILVLGESVAAVVVGMADADWRAGSLVVAAVAFVLTAALWWNYFDLGGAAGEHQLHEHEGDRSGVVEDRYVYGHLPLLLGLTLVGVGIEQYVAHPLGQLSAGGRWALCAGAALFLLGTAVVVAGTAGTWRAAWPWPLLAVPVVLGVGLLAGLSPVLAVSTVTLTLVLTVLAGVHQRHRGALETS